MKSKQKAKLILLVLSMILIISVVDINTTTNRTQTVQEGLGTSGVKDEAESDHTAIESPSSSAAEYVGINKTITAGVQANTWSENNIRNNDSFYDATEFAKESMSRYRDRPVSGWARYEYGEPIYFNDDGTPDLFGPHFTTDDRPISEVLRYNDHNYFFVSFGRGKWVGVMGWEQYSDPFNDNHELNTGVYKIKVTVDIVVEEKDAAICEDVEIRFRALHNTWSSWVPIIPAPVDEKPYTKTITIDDANPLYADKSTILSLIRQGRYIDGMEIKSQFFNPYFNSKVKVNVDFAKITYYYYEKEVDFEYELELDSDDIPDFQKLKTTADVTIDLEDSVPNIDLYLYDYTDLKWDRFGTTSSWDAEVIQFTVDSNIENYFSNANKTRIRFYNPKFIHYSALTLLWVDMIELDLTTGIVFDIHSPENKTYFKNYLDTNMYGYYPATNGFDNDTIGTEPEWFEQVGTPGGKVKVIEELGWHRKVLELNDTSPVSNAYVRKDLSIPQTYGTIEYWMRSDDVSKVNGFLLENGANPLIRTRTWSNYFQVLNGSIWQDVVSIQNNTWYHIRVDFECTTGLYSGLSQYNWCIYLNNTRYGNYNFISNEVQANHFWWFTDYAFGFSDYYYYIDAIGVSWDSSYSSGDNLNEGLLLSFTNYTNLVWMGYSLDNQDNKTIYGDRAIPMPEVGNHSIQLFGNNSIGTDYFSEKIHFGVSSAIPNITINTPEHIIYTEPMSGYYPATYGFENDEHWAVPEAWTGPVGPGVRSRGTVIDSLGNHEKVVEIDNIDWQLYYISNFFIGQKNGTIEFWLRVTNSSKESYFRCVGLNWSEPGPVIRIVDNKWQYRHSGATGIWSDINNLPAPLNNTWMHITLEFECGNGGYKGLAPDTYRIIMNENTSEDLPFRYARFNLFSYQVFTGMDFIHDKYRIYIDAVGYSWDEHYEIGDNKKEGLLLDFSAPVKLDWMVYSLDGQPNRTILGDIVFPFLEDGNHSIQVFGKSANNIIIKSRVRYFITDTTPPNSLISFNPHRGLNIINQSTGFTLVGDDGAGSGIDKIKYKINNTVWMDYDFSFTVPFSAPGFYNISYYAIDLAGHIGDINNITVELVKVSLLVVYIADHLYSTDVFNITLFICDELGQEIDTATIQLWWNGTQVSQSDITNLGGGRYVFSLTPITVAPGDSPIPLNMTITAEDCFVKYYETYLAVDPETIDKGQPPPPQSSGGGGGVGAVKPEELPLVLLITIVGASIVAGSIVFIIAWKKELLRKPKRE